MNKIDQTLAACAINQGSCQGVTRIFAANHSFTKKSVLIKGIAFSLLGYFCLACTTALSKSLPSRIPTMTLIFFQFLIPFLFTLPQLSKSGLSSLKPQQPGLVLLRALTGIVTFASLFYAVRHIALVDAVLLQNTTPLFVPFILLFWLKKNIPVRLWIPLILGFIGIMLILKPGTGMLNPFALLALFAGILSAITLVLMQKLKMTETTNRILFYYFIVGLIISGPAVILHWVPLTTSDWILLLGIGVFMYLTQFSITHAFAYGQAHSLAPFSYSTVVFSGLLGWMIWGHIPDWLSALGISLVILGGVCAIMLEKI